LISKIGLSSENFVNSVNSVKKSVRTHFCDILKMRKTMAAKFQELAQTDAVHRAQEHYYGKSQHVAGAPEHDPLTEDEISFIQSRDSFYMATVSETGWALHSASRRADRISSRVEPDVACVC
jgi:hypothetical protein